MRIIRFEDGSGQVRLGEWLADGRARAVRGGLFDGLQTTDEVLAVGRLLAPLEPVNIIAIGLNYRKHAEEGGSPIPSEPLIFSKLTSSVIASGEPIILPESAPTEVDWEAELAVVIGRTARQVSESDALSYVLGYTCANDVSARDCQRHRDKQWTRAKSFDTFCPLGPAILVDSSVNPNALRIRGRLNGQIMQDSSTADMIFSVPFLISYLSRQFTLRPGTVILTGTPEGVGFGRKPPQYFKPGDTYSVEIEGIGELTNPVVAAG
ncbi:MAG: fumarylacetoacetate hydrolase family protein [Phycisphaerae bacterium]|jgi:2-keto-4-pentenoate hydratase/2-oxohepta-3-ene-1,7-dioic acid hydratase in catechol pathway